MLSAYHVPGTMHGAGNAVISNSDGGPAFLKLRPVKDLDMKKICLLIIKLSYCIIITVSMMKEEPRSLQVM